NFWDEINVLNINEIYDPLQNFLDNWDIFMENTNEALDNLETNNENTSLSLQNKITQNEVSNEQQNLDTNENFENSSDKSSSDENNELSIIDKVKKKFTT
ncbi:9305_t:CDS:1, partial [Scutellospora calospora]